VPVSRTSGVTVIDGSAETNGSGRPAPDANVRRGAHASPAWSRFDASSPASAETTRVRETTRVPETTRRTYDAPRAQYVQPQYTAPAPQPRYVPPPQSAPRTTQSQSRSESRHTESSSSTHHH